MPTNNESSDNRSVDVNPYAPARYDVDTQPGTPIPTQQAAMHVANKAVLLQTVVGVGLAGAVFGFCFVFFNTNWRVEALVFAPFGLALGAIFATVAALCVIPVVFLLSLTQGARPWTKVGVYAFGATSGFFSGFCSFFVLLGFDARMLLISLVPALVGAVVTPFALRSLASRAENAWRQTGDKTLVANSGKFDSLTV